MKNRVNIEVSKTIVSAVPGSELHDCIRDAIELSAKENRIVELVHNDKGYTIDIADVMASIMANAVNNSKLTVDKLKTAFNDD